ncbi:suppressor of glycerol defect [Recurvomyces mirabilis]|nr:suppressor of glycerol defect [Recurvomyces mirabilis]
MARSNYGGPKLPKTLLDQMGGVEKRGGRDTSRKDRRKAERQAKKGGRVQISATARRAPVRLNNEEPDRSRVEKIRERPSKDAKPVKSILKSSRTAPAPTPESAVSDDESTAETELEDLGSEDEEEEGGDALSDAESDDSFTISRQAAKAGLADEDDEIAALERKLGVKSKKGSNEIGDDELDWLVTGSESEEEGTKKRKRPDEDAKWLRDKRLKMNRVETVSSSEDEEERSDDALAIDDESDGIESPFSEDEMSDDFGGFSPEDGEPSSPKRERENPYVAPVSKGDSNAGATGKYIPPSLRKAATSDEAVLKQLRRQIQGQLNRLSDANLLSILQAVEQIYEKSARQHVTSTLIDLLVGLVTDPAILNDTFLILHAGFVAALYKVVGTDFGARLVERLVEVLDGYRQADNAEGKQELNLVAFMSTLYAFQVISSAILFDYIRLFLSELTEDNTELLLRIIRTSGTQLRKDDPTALKNIVLLLQRQVTEAGEANISVRTRYMIDTIRDLKNNRMKTGVANSVVVAEHTTRMRKILGTLNTRPLRASEPLRITLADIRDSSKKGKWWLVGASYHDPAKLASTTASGATPGSKVSGNKDDGYESDTPGHVNLTKAARIQGMNTDIRRLIFINIVGAEDYVDAYQRLQALKLRSKQLAEVPGVLVHCAGVEQGWNPFYGFLARRLCEDGGNGMGKGFQKTLWNNIKKLAEQSEDDDDEGRDELTITKVAILARFYGFLTAHGCLSIAATKTLDYGLLSRPDTKAFVFGESLLTTILLQARKKNDDYEARLREIFSGTSRAPQMIEGLQLFMGNVITRAALVKKKKEEGFIRDGCEIVLDVLRKVSEEAVRGTMDEDGSEED